MVFRRGLDWACGVTATLANLLSNNHGLRVFCDAFKRVADIDVDAIAAKYGRGVTLAEIGAKARCNECGEFGGSV